MLDYELMEAVNRIAGAAQEHYCTSKCRTYENFEYATGTPPARYMNKASGLAQQQGYTLRYSDLPRSLSSGCDGCTIGYMHGCDCGRQHSQPFQVHIARNLPPAHEYLVTAHELAHVLLHHPPGNEHEYHRKIERRNHLPVNGAGLTEIPADEMAAHLAAAGASVSNGLRIANRSLCYLKDRGVIPEEERYAAFLAARRIGKVMS